MLQSTQLPPAVANTSDTAATLSERLRQFFAAYPHSTGKAACKALHLSYEKYGSTARSVKYRCRLQADAWGVAGGLVDGVHRVEFSLLGVPGWFVSLVVRCGWEFGWVSIQASNLTYYQRVDVHGRTRVYPKSRRMIVYPATSGSQHVMRAIMVDLTNVMAGGQLSENQRLEWNLFLDRLFKVGRTSYHQTISIPGMKNVQPFKVKIPDRGVTVLKDNSHPDRLEFIFSAPTGLQAFTETQAEFAQNLALHLEVLQGLREGVKAWADAVQILAKARLLS